MSPVCERTLTTFLARNWDQRSKLLLGLSGGPDSRALFYLLVQLKIPFAAAHLNHGWRTESDAEALMLTELARQQGIALYVRKAPPLSSKNIEDQGRRLRHRFFCDLMREGGFQAVLLAHHGDDQAETVLKRLFEGATLPRLGGLREVAHVEGLTLWRPWLGVRKKEIVAWLEHRGYSYFVDKTNESEKFLRGRMRQTLLPHLSRSFGKSVTPSLERVGRSAHELADFVEKIVAPFRERRVVSESATRLDLSGSLSLSAFELKCILRDFFEGENLVPSAHQIDAIYLHLKQNSAHKWLIAGKNRVRLHRGTLELWKGARNDNAAGAINAAQ